MKNKTALTEVQKKIYDSVTTEDWFTIFDLKTSIRNRESQCLKIAKKGYFEHKADFDPDYPRDLTMLISFFKKVKK
jgi:predicted DNA-binding ArsR family transcriptional regulator